MCKILIIVSFLILVVIALKIAIKGWQEDNETLQGWKKEQDFLRDWWEEGKWGSL